MDRRISLTRQKTLNHTLQEFKLSP
jgi:hypothetical protein